ncbi:MAG: hypothetical protein R3C19_20920 [Planctomycetaceae bacterium]
MTANPVKTSDDRDASHRRRATASIFRNAPRRDTYENTSRQLPANRTDGPQSLVQVSISETGRLICLTAAAVLLLNSVTEIGGAAAQQQAGSPVSDQPDAKGIANRDAGVITAGGRVLAPDGKPLAKAQIWLQRVFVGALVDEHLRREHKSGAELGWNEWIEVASTDSTGDFRLEVNRAEWNAVTNPSPPQLAATAEGFGFGLSPLTARADKQSLTGVTIETVRDLPIIGRMLTSDGQPAAETAVHVLFVRPPGEPPLDDYIAEVRSGGSRYSFFDRRSTLAPGLPAVGKVDRRFGQPNAVTDEDGRFVLNGIGADRIVHLLIAGPSIPSETIVVVTRNGFLRVSAPNAEIERETSGMLAGGAGGFGRASEPDLHQYFARFSHTGRPARTLTGIVRDRETHKPVAGVQLDGDGIPATTGADGRYTISGYPKQNEYQVRLDTTSGQYFNIAVPIPDAPGTGLLEYDIDLPKGITARGRVTDRDTGEPFKGTVEYNPLFPNKHLERQQLNQGSNFNAIPRSSVPIAADGTYELQVLPGPGILLVRDRHYLSQAAWFARKEIFTSPRIDLKRLDDVLAGANTEEWINTESLFHIDSGRGAFSMDTSGCKALALIDPPDSLLAAPDAADSLTQDLQVVRGRDIQGIVLDPDGKPAREVVVTGLSLDPVLKVFLQDEHFTVNCVSPDAPRRLVFTNPKRQLYAEVEIKPGHAGKLTVRLKNSQH